MMYDKRISVLIFLLIVDYLNYVAAILIDRRQSLLQLHGLATLLDRDFIRRLGNLM